MMEKIRTNQPQPERLHRSPGDHARVGTKKLSYVRRAWKKRSKLDVLAAAEEIHAAFPGRQANCEFMVLLRGSKKKGVELLREIVTFPGYTPEVTALDALAATTDMWTGKALIDMQVFWVNEITGYPFERFGHAMGLIIQDRGEKLVPEVWPRIIEWFKARPGSPKSFFNDPVVLAKAPNTEEISALMTALPAGRALEIAQKVLRGGRAV